MKFITNPRREVIFIQYGLLRKNLNSNKYPRKIEIPRIIVEKLLEIGSVAERFVVLL